MRLGLGLVKLRDTGEMGTTEVVLLSSALPWREDGRCHAERREASKIPPNQNPAKPPNAPPQQPRNASVRRAQGRFANRLCCADASMTKSVGMACRAGAQNDRMGQGLGDPTR